MEFVISANPNKQGEMEIVRFCFKKKRVQKPFIMIIKEYWYNGEVVNASVVWETNIKRLTLKTINNLKFFFYKLFHHGNCITKFYIG